MGIRQLAGRLADRAVEVRKGAKALADRLAEKKKAGILKPGEEKDWQKAILSNVKKAQELEADAKELKKLIG